jgi:hypothetical protein
MIVQTQTTSFKAELYEGIHDLIDDTIKIALFNANADLSRPARRLTQRTKKSQAPVTRLGVIR